jgi:hypothetical protein
MERDEDPRQRCQEDRSDLAATKVSCREDEYPRVARS